MKLGKAEVLEVLRRNPKKKFSCTDLAKKTGVGVRSIFANVRRLRDAQEVNFETTFRRTNNKDTYVYWSKERED